MWIHIGIWSELRFYFFTSNLYSPATSDSVYHRGSLGALYPSLDLDRKNPSEPKLERNWGLQDRHTALLANEGGGVEAASVGVGWRIAVLLFLYNKRGSL